MTAMRPLLVFVLATLSPACSDTPAPGDVTDIASDAMRTDTSAETNDALTDAVGSCSAITCAGAGQSCRAGTCTDDCRPADANACATGTVCDYADGRCRALADACVASATFEPCASSANPSRACGPGLQCDGQGSCLSVEGCNGLDCDASGRCWAASCSCTRPAPRCTPAPLARLNAPEFVGALDNGRDGEGAVALGFDDVCAAYAVTVISGPDYLRQVTADGTLTTWASVTNLDMGEVAVLRLPGGEFSDTLGDIAATYICCATCGCVETGTDARIGVVRLDRTSATRPLPNVLPAMATSGTGPFGNITLDSGPAGLTWGADHALYVGNVDANGDFSRIDLMAGSATSLTRFAARVVASTIFDAHSILVGLESGAVYRFDIYTGLSQLWAMLPAGATSLARDRFSGRVYAEMGGATPSIVSLAADGTGMNAFQTPPRVGRIAIAPDGYLYHLSVFPNVNWMSGDAIVRWPLPSTR